MGFSSEKKVVLSIPSFQISCIILFSFLFSIYCYNSTAYTQNQHFLAANVKNKSGSVDSNIKSTPPIQKPNIVIRPKLEVRVLSGEFEKWGNSITIQKPDSLTFRWGYFGSAAKSALWYLSDKPFDSSEKPNFLKRGQIKYIPEHGKFGLFNIKLSDYLPPNPFNGPRSYYARVVPLNEKFFPIESPSLPVVITYKKPAKITEFHPYEFDKKMQIKRFKPLHKIRIHAITTQDTKGAYKTTITPDEIKQQVDTANLVWWLSGIEFVFDPKTDYQHIKNTELNRFYPLDEYVKFLKYNRLDLLFRNTKYTQAKIAFAEKKHKGKLFVIYMHGSNYEKDPETNLYNITPMNESEPYWEVPAGSFPFIIMRGNVDRYSYNKNLLAHKIGHHLGIQHTYPTSADHLVKWASKTLKQAILNGDVLPTNALDYFDADKNTVSDTPPDLGRSIFYYTVGSERMCDLKSYIRIPVFIAKKEVNYTLDPDKLNIMSNFYDSCFNKVNNPISTEQIKSARPSTKESNSHILHLSTEQIKRARQTLENGSRKYLIQ